MKIVRIIARLNVGGPARHVVWLTAGLQTAEHESVLVAGVAPPGEDDMGYFASELGVKPLIISQMSREISLKDVVTIWKLYRLFGRERPDIVHTHTAKAGTVGRIAGILYRWLTVSTLIGRPRRCRFVHTYHGHIFHSYYGRWKTKLFLLIERALAWLVTDRIVVISPQQRREIHEDFGVGKASQFEIIPLGLDTSVFSAQSERRGILRSELGVGERDVLVGIVGRLTEIKNHAMFVEAAARFKKDRGVILDGRRVRFVIIGDGQMRAALERDSRQRQLDDDLVFLGTRTDPENFYPALDIVALTSLNEGTPLTLLEAMANSRPIIATEVGGVIDLLGKRADAATSAAAIDRIGEFQVYEHGVGTAPNDIEGFCEGLAFLVANEDLRRAMGLRGRQFVGNNYSKDRLLADVTKLYRELATDRTLESGAWNTSAKQDNGSLPSDSRLPTPDSRLQ